MTYVRDPCCSKVTQTRRQPKYIHSHKHESRETGTVPVIPLMIRHNRKQSGQAIRRISVEHSQCPFTIPDVTGSPAHQLTSSPATTSEVDHFTSSSARQLGIHHHLDLAVIARAMSIYISPRAIMWRSRDSPSACESVSICVSIEQSWLLQTGTTSFRSSLKSNGLTS